MYRNLSNSMAALGFKEASKFFLKEAKTEAEHYQILADFCNQMGILPVIVPPVMSGLKIETLEDAFAVAFAAEHNLMREYNNLVKKINASEDVDITTVDFLIYFVNEQRNAVGEYGDYLATLSICAGNPAALLQFESELNG
jgi:ferritin